MELFLFYMKKLKEILTNLPEISILYHCHKLSPLLIQDLIFEHNHDHLFYFTVPGKMWTKGKNPPKILACEICTVKVQNHAPVRFSWHTNDHVPACPHLLFKLSLCSPVAPVLSWYLNCHLPPVLKQRTIH